jgi:hypothetical protein
MARRELNAPGKEGLKKKRKRKNRVMDGVRFQSRKRNR